MKLRLDHVILDGVLLVLSLGAKSFLAGQVFALSLAA